MCEYSITTIKGIKPSSFRICRDRVLINDNNNVKAYSLNDKLFHNNFFVDSMATIFSDSFYAIVSKSLFETIFYDYNNEAIATQQYIAASAGNGKLQETEEYLYPLIYLDSRFDIPYYGKVSKSDFSLVSSYETAHATKGVGLIVSDREFVNWSQQLIALNDFVRNVIWQHKFSDLIQADDAYLNSEIIEVGGKLYFTLNSQKGGDPGIICLDVQSGELIRHFAGTFFGVFKDNDFVFSTKYQNILCRIDSRTNEIETWDVGQLLKENNFKSINDHRCTARDGKFYFTQTFGDHNAKLGILNFDKKTMDYKYDFEPSHGAIGSIKLGKDRIFVHTQDYTLHIFEKYK